MHRASIPRSYAYRLTPRFPYPFKGIKKHPIRENNVIGVKIWRVGRATYAPILLLRDVIGYVFHYAATFAIAFQVPGAPAVVHTHPGAPPAAVTVLKTMSPFFHVPVPGAAPPYVIVF